MTVTSFARRSFEDGIVSASCCNLQRHTRTPSMPSTASSPDHASLLQSAAKSTLSFEEEASLHSLKTEKELALPDEQDRKRFVGALAAVLAEQHRFEDDVSVDSSFPDESETETTRRYQVLSKLLVSAADCMLLEESQSKAFLPMLSRLRRPTPLSTRNRPLLYPAQRSAIHKSTSFADEPLPSKANVHDFASYDDEIDRIPHLRPFVESLTHGSGLRCVSLMLLQHLLQSHGYDARVRHALKTVSVLVLAHPAGDVATATRQFEALEQTIALQLIRLSDTAKKPRPPPRPPSQGLSRKDILRGIKIGGTAVVAGTLFAVTGGLAAPTIAAGMAALAGSSILTSTAAVTAIFGVGGGSLAAYKMQRRTQGLTEFEFSKESESSDLFSTICLSGWLRDECDFQRPWGVTPTHPRIASRLELLERFYSIHSPDHVPKSAKILESWKGEERALWKMLQRKYGRDPDHLFPLHDGPRDNGTLTLEQREIVGRLFVELGYVENVVTEEHFQPTPLERMRKARASSGKPPVSPDLALKQMASYDSIHGPSYNDCAAPSRSFAEASSVASSGFDSESTAATMASPDALVESRDTWNPPKHLSTVWDYQARYGGELYTIQWESHLLTELCDSVSDLAVDIVSGGAQQLLKHTALSGLLSMVAWPVALVNAANMIDGTWTLAVERSDEAGKELARSLLFSRAGHRPVTLVGYSFGARVVYSCLKELARIQEKWEEWRLSNRRSHEKRDGEMDFKKMREPASIVEDAIIMGLPNHLSISSWQACRQVVAGRLVNCFSQKDLILSLMFQFKRFGLKPVCGTCPVAVPGVENIDVTGMVKGHQDYCVLVGDILRHIRHGQPLRSRPAKSFDLPDFAVGTLPDDSVRTSLSSNGAL